MTIFKLIVPQRPPEPNVCAPRLQYLAPLGICLFAYLVMVRLLGDDHSVADWHDEEEVMDEAGCGGGGRSVGHLEAHGMHLLQKHPFRYHRLTGVLENINSK